MEATELFCYRDQAATIDKQGKGGEAFIVEDLLDFSNEDDGLCAEDDIGFGAVLDDSTLTALDSTSDSSSGSDSHFPGNFACRGVADAGLSDGLSDGLSVPYDEIAELEWLSNFVEESFTDEDLQRLQLISGAAKSSSPSLENEASGEQKGAVPAKIADVPFPEKKVVPAKARSKRSRPAPSSWSSRLLVLTAGTSSCDLEGAAPAPNSNPGGAPLPRKVPKTGKKEADWTEGPAPPPDGRRCLHCNTDKTPQWRTGPMGPKTLCNACGVRYKSGRLVAEYRPAASPTFVPSLHSNSHRKVLELLRQKEQRQRTAASAGGGQFLHPGEIFDPPKPPAADDLLLHHHLGPDFRQLI